MLFYGILYQLRDDLLLDLQAGEVTHFFSEGLPPIFWLLFLQWRYSDWLLFWLCLINVCLSDLLTFNLFRLFYILSSSCYLLTNNETHQFFQDIICQRFILLFCLLLYLSLFFSFVDAGIEYIFYNFTNYDFSLSSLLLRLNDT